MAHPHIHNDYLYSLSSLTSLSSEASVEFYKARIKPGIDIVSKSQATLQELANAAEKVVNEKFAPDCRSIFKYTKDSNEMSVKLSEIMLAMLASAEECGGESGKRYVASAILACSKEEDEIAALAALGTTWLTHLLFIFKTSRGHGNQSNKRPSELATPTVETTATHLLDGVGHRAKPFLDDVMRRDGYTCVVTGYQDPSHPKPTAGIIELSGAHILRRAIGEFDSDPKSESYKSAMTTFDILVNFTRLPLQTLEELHENLDGPSNGMILQGDAHRGFDRFYWCLKKTEKEHVYDLKVFVDRNLIRKPENNRITFVDHSNDFLPDPTCKRSRPIDLPDPRYIEIHAAITGILNMSGAGKFFDELLDEYQDDEGNVPGVRCWPELETLMGSELLRESTIQMFQSVKAH